MILAMAPSDSPLYGTTLICRGYGKPSRPPVKVEAVTHTDEVDNTQDSTSNNNVSSVNVPNKEEGGES